MSSNTTTSPALEVTGNPINETYVHEAVTEAFAVADAADEELETLVKDVAAWLHKQFHLIPKTPEEKTAAQNAEATVAKVEA